MLAAIEDLLDSWPGTLLVVSHDRYFLERVTDQQYAILPGPDGVGRLRHLPGGVDEYLRLRTQQSKVAASATPAQPAASATPALSGAELRAAEKELAATERKIAKLSTDVDARKHALAEHDQSDYEGLAVIMKEITATEAEVAALEDRWLELSESLG